MSNAGEKTEAATPKRRDQERGKGNIPKSADLSAAVMVTLGVSLLSVFSKQILTLLQTMMFDTFTHLNPKNISTEDVLVTIKPFFIVSAKILLPFLLILMVIGAISIRMQIGHVLAWEKLKFDLGNISPSKALNNAKNMFNPASTRNLVEFVKSLLKLLIIFSCGYSIINGRKDELYALLGANIDTSFAVIGSILVQMLFNICMAMIVIGFIDRKYQVYEYEKSIKMTKAEVQDEAKNSDGDPKIKAKIRSMGMRIMRQTMLANTAKADVVVTNPTHYAVALRYDKLTTPAPQVVAKGVDFLAFKIREVAQNNNVPIVENPPLARALYKLVPVDGIIPQEMFVAVAEVLAYVYNKDKQGVNGQIGGR